MDDVKTKRDDDDWLPSADFGAAGMILILFLFSMAFMLRLFPFETFVAEADIQRLNLIEQGNYDEVGFLALTKPFPPSGHLTPPPAFEKKTEDPGFEFPPFKGKKGEKEYHPIIDKIAERHEMDPALIKAMVMAESGYDPSAVSSKGAVGLMQLMPGTAESLGVVNRFNPEQNVRGGVKYIKKLIKRLDGDLKLAIAAYNSGLGPVLKHKGVPPYKATRIYVHKVLHYYRYYRKQESAQVRQDENKSVDEKKSPRDVDEA